MNRNLKLRFIVSVVGLAACGPGSRSSIVDGGDAGLLDSGGSSPDDAGDGGVDGGIDGGDGGTVDGGSVTPYGHGCSGSQDVTGFVHRSGMIGTDGLIHDYYTYVPAAYDPATQIPVVVSLHGAGDTAPDFLQLWQANADQQRFLVLLPEASAPLGTGFTWYIRDTNVVYGAITDINRCYNTDPHRQIIHGFSAGGFLAYIMGLSQSGRFSGLAIASSDLGSSEYYFGGPLLPSAWDIPVSMYHGYQDPNFPFEVAGQGSHDALVDAGHVVYWHPFDGGHITTAADNLQMYEDLQNSLSP